MAYKKNNSSEKDAFLIHNSQYQAVRNFSNEDYGKLFHAICRYHIKEDIGDLDDKIQVAFEFFKVQFEYDREKWEKIRESRSASGKKGGRPKSKPKQTKANKANAFSEKQTEAKEAVNVNGNVNGNVNDNKKKASPSDEIITILEDLNKRTKSKKGFSPLAQCNQNLIKARMSEGFTVENFITVNEKKVKQWLHDPEMSKYLRPATLYGNKFDGYLNEVVCDLPATNSNSLNKNKFQSADERRIENNKKIFEESLVEVKNERNRQEEEGGDSGFFSQLHGELPESHN